MSEVNESGGDPLRPSPWGHVGVVLLTEYDHYDRLKKLDAEVRAVLGLFGELGFDVTDTDTLKGDGRAFSLLSAMGVWQPSGHRLIVYWAGHGKAIENGRLFLVSRDTVKVRQPEAHNAVPAGSIGDLLAGKAAVEIVLLLDACGSGGGAEEIVEAFRAKTNSRAYSTGFKPGLAVISSAGQHQFAREGAFSSALVSVLRDGPPADPSYLAWTDRDEYVTPAELFQAIRVRLARAPSRGGVQIPEYDATSGVGRFFPNPRHRRRIPDVGVAEKRRRSALLPSAVAEHFMLKFRGIDTIDDRGWFFTGREQLLGRLARWLGGTESGLLVITGPPGCGKSALLGRLAVLSVPQYRAEVKRAGGLDGVRAETLPPKNSLDAGVHAKNLSLADCISELADALHLPGPRTGWRSAADFVRQVASLRRPLTLLLDALDEAQSADIYALAVDLLRPLAELPGLKILVGTRPDRASREVAAGVPSHGSLLNALGVTEQEVIRLDRDADTVSDIVAYVQRRLLNTAGSPYRDKPAAAAAAATLIARRSDRIFLIARLMAHELVQRKDIPDLTYGGQEQDQILRMVEGSLAAAFTADLARYGQDEPRVRAMLTPLAFAEGSGLPSRDVWLAMAGALTTGRSPLNEADLSWLVSHAGAYLIESGEDGQTVYRLYHQAFADYLRRDVPLSARAIQVRITGALTAGVPDVQGLSWNLANPYTLRHLATHAVAAGRLGNLVADSRYLIYADPQNLQRALAMADRDHPLVRLYLRCVDGRFGVTMGDRAAIMQGVALRDEPEAVPLLRTDFELSWRGLWSAGLRAAFHRSLPSHASPVTAVAFGRSGTGTATLVATAAGDGVVRLWNAATGERWNRFDSGSGTVFAITFFSQGTHQLLATGGQDGSVRFWDIDEGQQVRSLAAHSGPVFALALTATANGVLLASAGEDGVIQLWDTVTGQARGRLVGHHSPVRALAFKAEPHGATLVSGGDDGRVRIWDLERMSQLTEFGGTGWIYAVAVGAVGGRTVLATGSAFGTVRLWDLTTSASLARFVGHQGAVGALALGVLDGRMLLATGGDDGAIRLWDPLDGRLQQTLTRSATRLTTDRVTARGPGQMALGSRLTVAASSDPGPEDVVEGVGQTQSIQALAWSVVSGKPLLASGDGDWTPRLWEPGSGTGPVDSKVGLVRSLAVGQAYGYRLIAEGCQDKTVRLREAATGRELRILDTHRRAVIALAFGDIDGRPVLASASEDGTVVLQDAMTGTVMQTLDVRITSMAAFAEAVALTEFEGRPVVLAANGFDPIGMWDARTGKQWRLLDGPPKGNRLAVGKIDQRPVVVIGNAIGQVVVTDLATGHATSLDGHDERQGVQAIACADLDGQTLAATASKDRTVRVWDLMQANPSHVLSGHSGPVNTVTFGRIGAQLVLVSAGQDCSVRVWDPISGESLGRLADHAVPVAAAVMFDDTDGQPLVCTGAEDGTHLIRLSPSFIKDADSGSRGSDSDMPA
jgi:WD40 repeat protein